MSAWQRSLEWYFGVQSARAGEGTRWRAALAGAELASGWWPALLIAAGLLIVGIYVVEARRIPFGARCLLLLCRLGALAVLALWLGGLTLHVVRTGLPTLVVMIDTSASMGLEDHYSEPGADEMAKKLMRDSGAPPTRLNLAKALLTGNDAAWLKELSRRYRVRLYEFDENAGRLAPAAADDAGDRSAVAAAVAALEANGTQTRPGPALEQILADYRDSLPAGIAILTDGIASVDARDRLSFAAQSTSGEGGERVPPLFPIALGSREPARDVELFDLQSDPAAFVDEPVMLNFQVKSYGFARQLLDIVVRAEGRGEPPARMRVRLGADGVASPLQMSFTPRQEGDYEIEVECVPLAGETQLENNRLRRHLRVRSEQIHVLLSDRAPRWEYRHLKAVLERDDAVELQTVLQESDLEHRAEDRTALAGFPATKAELFAFDVIVLGDLDLSYLNPGTLEHLQEFVRERGGGVILIAGEKHNPIDFARTALEPMLPIPLEDLSVTTEAEFRIEPTRAGRANPILRLAETDRDNARIWSELPPLHWAIVAPNRKPGAIVLAAHATRQTGSGRAPIILLQRYGSGQVLFHATDELWLWRRQVEDLYYGRYWSHAVRFLCRSRLLGDVEGVELTAERARYAAGEAVGLRARFVNERAPDADQRVTVIAERGDGRRETLLLEPSPDAAGVYRSSLPQPAAGSYHAWLAEPALAEAPPACDFVVEAPQSELARRAADLDDLARAATLSGGRSIPFDKAEELISLLPRGNPVPIGSEEALPLWNRLEMLLLFVGLLTAEWLLRKRWRLI